VIPLDYLPLRVVRRHLPDEVVRTLLRRHIIIKPGLETTAPAEAIQRFLDAVTAAGEIVGGKRILILGYGGNFGVGVGLLHAGARHVVLVDPYAKPDRWVNLALARAGSPYLRASGPDVVPVPEYLTVVDVSLSRYLADGGEQVDMVFSNSVLEHVIDMVATAGDLARATVPGGQQFHFVDLRDHFFKHPFEMLCHSEKVWRGLLNPGSNLNRLRATDYARIFCANFPHVTIEPLTRDLAGFRKARPRIRPEFLTGDDQQDAITRIYLRASV
jgi:hypothetical protein